MEKLLITGSAGFIGMHLCENLLKDNEDVQEILEPLRPFLALKTHRSRIKCMKLAWDALEECANLYKNKNYN